MNAKIIVAMKGIRDNLNTIIEEMENMGVTVAEDVAPKNEVPTAPKEDTPAPNTAPKSRKEREASEKLPDASNGLTEEQLNSLSYNNLKRLAKEMGIPATGARDELTKKILSYDGEVPNPNAPVEETPAEEETPAPAKTTRNRKIQKSQPVEEPEEDDDDDNEDPIVAKVNEAVEDMTNEEIADILADVGVKAKGKRQSLISAVIQAVKDGKIDLDDESEDDEGESEETASAESEETDEEEFDVNDPENPDMTKERKTALEAYKSEVETDFADGGITREQIVEWLNEYHGTKDSMKKKSDEELVEEYIYYSSLLIDDEGEMPEEEGAYTVNGVPYCCGHELAYNEDNETYICETCGAEYEAGEE